MKKILVLTRAFENGGLEVALAELIARLDKRKYNITILCIEKIGELQSKIPAEVKVEELFFYKERYRIFVNHRKMPNSGLLMLLNKIHKKSCELILRAKENCNPYYEYVLKRTARTEDKYDILLDFYGYGHFLSVYGAKYVRADKKAMWLHDESMDWVKQTEPYLRSYDKFFCVSKTVRKNFIERCPQYETKAEVLYNYIDIDRVKVLAGREYDDEKFKGDFKILTVGRLAEQKGYDYAVECAKILKEKNFSFVWYVAGEGKERKKLESLIQEYNLEKNFILLGNIENPYPYIKNCDLYVQPSRHEGFGIAVLEAKILCRPIIISATPCLAEQIEDGKNGFIVELSAGRLADKVMEVYSNPEIVGRVVQTLKNTNFDYNSEIERLENFLDN